MKKKELRAIAEKIAKAEMLIQTSNDKDAIRKAQEEIMKISSHITDMEDLDLIDELVQEILEKNI